MNVGTRSALEQFESTVGKVTTLCLFVRKVLFQNLHVMRKSAVNEMQIIASQLTIFYCLVIFLTGQAMLGVLNFRAIAKRVTPT